MVLKVIKRQKRYKKYQRTKEDENWIIAVIADVIVSIDNMSHIEDDEVLNVRFGEVRIFYSLLFKGLTLKVTNRNNVAKEQRSMRTTIIFKLFFFLKKFHESNFFPL